ncbi:MAG TPA: KTSC domain-containing protein [Solirubrobacterales bacterium]
MTVPRLQAVESSCVARIGYDEAAEEAYVEFHDSGAYAYRGVPAQVFEEFLRADSKGVFVNTVIKPRYSVRRL